jgi:hypothetical protein
MLIFGALTFGIFMLGFGMRPSTPLRCLLRLSTTPPASPSNAAPPAAAGTFALSANATSFDLSLPLRLADPPELDFFEAPELDFFDVC